MNFQNLFILDLANNHQGDVDHAFKIIDSMPSHPNTSIKLQLRDLDTFIHPDYTDSKMGQRFLSTRLSKEDIAKIAQHIKERFLLSCTPFDEVSVGHAVELGSDFLKVASCSANDWDLMEEVSKAGLPVVVSTGGLDLRGVDRVVSFCEHKGLDFALHHCVSIYPTKMDQMNLWKIQEYKDRYPDLTIGWSTHEDPNNYLPIVAAYSAGARMFERHIGLRSPKYDLNAYSSTGEQIREWLDYWQHAVDMGNYKDISGIEQENLQPLKRGYYDGKRMIPFNGSPEKVYTDALHLKEAIHEIKAILNYAHIKLPPDFELEFSHHYGVKEFREIGVTMISIFNRHYAKKLLIMLPGQKHPAHYHKIKDEAFHVLYGELDVVLDGEEKTLKTGETAIVPPGVWHSFSSKEGCVFEEVSTTSINGDSVYWDITIHENKDRKTIVKNWGRYELEQKHGEKKRADDEGEVIYDTLRHSDRIHARLHS